MYHVTKKLEILWKFLAQQWLSLKTKFSFGIDVYKLDKLHLDINILVRMSLEAFHLD
jgi:hypothetical protein